MKFLYWLKNLFNNTKKNNSIPSNVIKLNPVPKWFEIANKEIGIKEVRNGENPRIIEYHMCTSLKATDDETPWCSAFVCWTLEQSGIRSPRNAWARSFMGWGVELKEPRTGCICVFKRGADSGHVGLFVLENKNTILVLGGNQSNAVNVSEYSKDNLLGYRWPKE